MAKESVQTFKELVEEFGPNTLGKDFRFSGAIYSETSWYFQTQNMNSLSVKVSQPPSKKNKDQKQALNSLKDYVEQEVQKTNSTKIKRGNIELSVKKEHVLEEEEVLYRFSDPIQTQASSTKVLFVTKALQEDSESLQLLNKMIDAMKLSPNEWSIVHLNPEGEHYPKADFELIATAKPDYVVALGGLATHLLLKRKERLQSTHGKFYKRGLLKADQTTLSFEMMPVFHPDYLLINPNMKRAAWTDLQQVMKKLGKM